MACISGASAARVALCEWDSAFFGFPVAELHGGAISADALEAHLLDAQRDGYSLVYWRSEATTAVPSELLERFNGSLVDRRLTYSMTLANGPISGPKPSPLSSVTIAEFPPGPAPAALVELAIEAGKHSRFRVDPRFPTHLFQSLYSTWICRSTLREIADVVFVAVLPNRCSAGMISVSLVADRATIGLIAVAEHARGQGIGRALIAAAHRHSRKKSATQATVTTQHVNAGARALYERSGYAIASASSVYHFWPQQ